MMLETESAVALGRPVSFGDSRATIEVARKAVRTLDEAGLMEMSEAMSRLIDRSLRQEILLKEERERSHALEMRLANLGRPLALAMLAPSDGASASAVVEAD